MRCGEIKDRPGRDDSGGVDIRVGRVIVSFDVIEIHGLRDAGKLIEVPEVTLQIRVIDDPAEVALEVAVINDVETHERAEEAPIGFDKLLAEKIA